MLRRLALSATAAVGVGAVAHVQGAFHFNTLSFAQSASMSPMRMAMQLAQPSPETGADAVSPLAQSQTTKQTKSPMGLRVVSYNVLSSSLAGADHYNSCNPEDLDSSTRLERVKRQLETEMKSSAVICLQEVSADWAGALIPFFEERKYTFVTGLYGNAFNGYMGCAVAWPAERFRSVAVDLSRASDTKPWPRPPSPPPRSTLAEIKHTITRTAVSIWVKVRGVKEGSPFDPWAEAERRRNILLSAKLACKQSGAQFSVSTYHMPCLFGSVEKVQVMVVHAALVAQRAAAFAEGLPFILAGDFNAVPGSPPYSLLTKGALPSDDEHVPHPREHDAWTPALPLALRSAYAEALGAEPRFTNYAKTSWNKEGAFMETLDYVFLSSEWRVKGIKSLPEEDATRAAFPSFPSAEEPSDHILIAADLELATS